MPVQDFQVNVSESILADLRERIRRTRWPDEITDSGWTYGADLAYIKDLAAYWLEGFDWRDVESRINVYPNFVAEIAGHKIHFIHVKGIGKRSVPLILTHGWPGSFLEFMKLIPLLTAGAPITFDLVIPSLPGYGFSGKSTSPGCNIHVIADLWRGLMDELNYERFGAHGGDFGSGVSTVLALKYPRRIIGLHVNSIESYFSPYVPDGEHLSTEEIQFMEESGEWDKREGGYAHQQTTRPLTLAYGLNDSPVGLCAWIIEKFFNWSECNGSLESIFTRDELLANITLYWVTQTIHSSIRLYHETRKVPLRFSKDDFVSVPVGITHFPSESPFPPRRYIERSFKVQRWTEMPAGGHFAAMEQPGLLADDIRAFFDDLVQ